LEGQVAALNALENVDKADQSEPYNSEVAHKIELHCIYTWLYHIENVSLISSGERTPQIILSWVSF